MNEVLAKLLEIKSVLRDRMKVLTEEGNELGEVLDDLEKLIKEAMLLKPKK